MSAPLNWDAWRAAYPTMTYQDQVAFHAKIYQHHPTQTHYDLDLVRETMHETDARTIVELGGWDGDLAERLLASDPLIERWVNIELCRPAAEGTSVPDPRYKAPDIGAFYWDAGPWTCDLFIASHTIEHLSGYHLDLAVKATDAPAVYFDAPLTDEPNNWRGFTGTHILEYGWIEITWLMRAHGYQLEWAIPHETSPESGGQAEARLYTKEPT